MSYGPGWFTRLWNSSLGLPQQLLFRLAHVARGKANLFSEEGLLDASLIPLAGAVDDHQYDLSGKDIFGDHGWASNLLLEVATDPTTYMTFGASAAAKASRALVKAADAAGLAKYLDKGESAASVVAQLRDAAKTGIVPIEARPRMNSMLDAAEKAAAGTDWWKTMSWGDLQKMGLDHELLVGPPILAERYGMAFRVPTAHKTWTGLLVGHPIEATASKAYAYLGSRQNLIAQKVLLPLVQPIAAFAKGASVGTTGRFLLSFEAAPESIGKQIDEVATRIQSSGDVLTRNADLISSWGSKLSKHQGKGLSPEESFRRLWGIKQGGEETVGNITAEWNMLREKLGLSPAPLTFRNIRELWADGGAVAQRDRDFLLTASLNRKPTGNQELLRTHRRSFEAGERFARGFHRMFIGDTGFKQLDEASKGSTQAAIAYTRDTEATAGLVETMYVRLSKDMGMSTPEGLRQVKHGVTRLLEMAPHADEIGYIARGQQEASEAYQSALGALNRARGTVEEEPLRLAAQGALRDITRFWQDDLTNWLRFRLPDAANLTGVEDSPIRSLMERGFMEAGIPREVGKTRKALGGPYGDLMKLRGQGLSWAENAKAALEHGQNISVMPPAFWGALEDAAGALSERMLTPFLSAGGEAANDVWTALRGIQSTHLKMSSAYGFVGRSLPVAYVPRILSSEEVGRVREIIGGFDEQKLKNIIGEPRAARIRNADKIGVMELNGIVNDLRKWDLAHNGDDSIRKLVDGLAERIPEIESKFVDDAASAFLTSMSSMKEIDAVSHLFDDINKLSANPKNGVPVIGARAVGYFQGGKVHVREGRKISSKILNDGRIATRLQRTVNGLPEEWLVFERADGEQFVMPLASTENGMVIARAGEGEQFGQSAALTLSRQGRMATVGATTSKAEIESMVKRGEWAMIGDQAVLSGIQDAAGKTLSETPTWVRAGYDTIHSYFQAANTVVKPSFYLFNYASAPLLLSLAGASVDAILGAFRDAAVLFSKNREFAGEAGRIGKWQRDSMGVFAAAAARGAPGTRRAIEMARQTRASILGAGMGDAVFDFGHGFENMADTIKVWRESGLLNTFGSEGLRGITRESRRLANIQRDVDTLYGLADKGDLATKAGNLTAVGKEALSRLGEAAEIQVRVAGYAAFRRMGLSPEVAAQASKNALVDYGDLTRFEKTWAKRGTSFYSFPRKVTPATFKRIAKDPGGFGAFARTMFGLPFVDADSGTLEARLGDFRVNLQRAIPQFDALSAGAFAADWMFNWDGFKSTPERIGNSPFGLAIPLDVVRSGVGASFGGGAEMWRAALRNAATTRWAVSGRQDDPAAPGTTMYDQVMRFMIGVDRPGELVRRKWLKGQYDMLLNEARERIRQEPEDAAFWRDEIQALAATTTRLLQ